MDSLSNLNSETRATLGNLAASQGSPLHFLGMEIQIPIHVYLQWGMDGVRQAIYF